MILPALSRGGAERQCLTLAKELKKNSWKVDILLFKNKIDWKKHELKYINNIYRIGLKSTFLLLKSKYRVRLFWMSTPILVGRFLLSAKNRYTVRASRINQKLSFAFKVTRFFSGKTSFNSEHSISYYINNKLVKNKNLYYIPNYSRGFSNELNLKSDELTFKDNFNLIMIAHWRKNKDFNTLFEAIGLLKNNTNVKLHLFGDIGKNNEMINLSKRKGVYDRCVFHGVVENPWNVVKPNINILSSIYEGTPNSIMEGISLGIPYIMSDISELKDLNRILKGGFLFPKKNSLALAEIIDNQIKYKDNLISLGQKGKKNLKKFFNKDRITKLWLDFLN